MLRLVSPITAYTVMLARLPKRRNIKYFDNSICGYSAHVFLKYTPTGGYAKNPIIFFLNTIAWLFSQLRPMEVRQMLGIAATHPVHALIATYSDAPVRVRR